ncbi:MAG: SHOCT domain-containing protein [Lachnospiraceae bacterium]|nr:SHOCT domain-containing protein [Lachnospiraceae bacterium]
MIFLYIVIGIAERCFWGWATNKVVENKGYTDSWFIWGFLLGLLAFIIALTREDCHSNIYSSPTALTLASKEYEDELKDMHASGKSWQCRRCKKINPYYIGTCSCGNTKRENNGYGVKPAASAAVAKPVISAAVVKPADDAKSKGSTANAVSSASKDNETKQDVQEAAKSTEAANEAVYEDREVRILKQYKALLDSGIITQQEFDNKKKQIFGLIDAQP